MGYRYGGQKDGGSERLGCKDGVQKDGGAEAGDQRQGLVRWASQGWDPDRWGSERWGSDMGCLGARASRMEHRMRIQGVWGTQPHHSGGRGDQIEELGSRGA